MNSFRRVLESVAAAVVSALQESSRFPESLAQAAAAVRSAWLATAPPAAEQFHSTQEGATQGSAASPVALAIALAEGRVALYDGAQTTQGQGRAPYPDG